MKKKGISNTQRTLRFLKDKGMTAGMVERWLNIPGYPGGGVRKDLFGFIDIIALSGKSIIGVQSCGSSFAEHERTIKNEPLAKEWLLNGGEIMLVGWRKLKLKRGMKAMRWFPRVKMFSLIEDFS